jgi:hypothetical protein
MLERETESQCYGSTEMKTTTTMMIMIEIFACKVYIPVCVVATC